MDTPKPPQPARDPDHDPSVSIDRAERALLDALESAATDARARALNDAQTHVRSLGDVGANGDNTLRIIEAAAARLDALAQAAASLEESDLDAIVGATTYLREIFTHTPPRSAPQDILAGLGVDNKAAGDPGDTTEATDESLIDTEAGVSKDAGESNTPAETGDAQGQPNPPDDVAPAPDPWEAEHTLASDLPDMGDEYPTTGDPQGVATDDAKPDSSLSLNDLTRELETLAGNIDAIDEAFDDADPTLSDPEAHAEQFRVIKEEYESGTEDPQQATPDTMSLESLAAELEALADTDAIDHPAPEAGIDMEATAPEAESGSADAMTVVASSEAEAVEEDPGLDDQMASAAAAPVDAECPDPLHDTDATRSGDAVDEATEAGESCDAQSLDDDALAAEPDSEHLSDDQHPAPPPEEVGAPIDESDAEADCPDTLIPDATEPEVDVAGDAALKSLSEEPAAPPIEQPSDDSSADFAADPLAASATEMPASDGQDVVETDDEDAPEAPDTPGDTVLDAAEPSEHPIEQSAVDPEGAHASEEHAVEVPEASSADTPDDAADDAASQGPTMLSLEDMMAMMGEEASDDEWGTRPLTLPPEKAELLQFMVSDLRSAAEKIEPILAEATDAYARGECGEQIAQIAQEMHKTSDFFEFKSLRTLVELLDEIGGGLADCSSELLPELFVRMRAICTLIDQHAGALEVGMETFWPLGTLGDRVRQLLRNEPLDPAIAHWHLGDTDRVLELDKVVEGIETPPETGGAPFEPPAEYLASLSGGAPVGASRTGDEQAPGEDAQSQTKKPSGPMVRIPQERIESLLDVARQLVLSKNRVVSLSRAFRDREGDEAAGDLAATADELNRLTGELQSSVMDMRTQPVERLFERYPRVIRDVARLADKQIDVHLRGVEAPVDRAVLEQLVEPLNQILRGYVCPAIETPADRAAARKTETGNVVLAAQNQGAHMVISVEHDGRGFDRDQAIHLLAASGVETEDALQARTDLALFDMMLQDEASESPLVGLAATLAPIGAFISLDAHRASGMLIEITVPLTSSVIPGMMVGVGAHTYAVPLQTIREIVKTAGLSRYEVAGRDTIRLRDDVMPLLDLRRALGEDAAGDAAFAVVVTIGDDLAALAVDRIVGQREVVIERLKDDYVDEGPFSGATIGKDGDVHLIIDVPALMRQAEQHRAVPTRSSSPEPHAVG